MITCLIVDDEPVARDILENYVSRTPFLDLKGKCGGVTEALKHLDGKTIDLLFLDIQMPGINGVDFSRTLSGNIKVIFTTAFEQYALEGFKVNAMAYLLKPFSYPEFLEATMRAKEWFDLKAGPGKMGSNPADDGLFVKSEYKLVNIKYRDILYVEGMKDYAKFFLAGESKPVYTLMSLKSLEDRLPAGQFMRVHRSYIVNLDRINAVERSEIIFGDISIPVAENYKAVFQNFLKSRF